MDIMDGMDFTHTPNPSPLKGEGNRTLQLRQLS